MNVEDGFMGLGPPVSRLRTSWYHLMMPYVEQSALYNQFAPMMNLYAQSGAEMFTGNPISWTVVPTFMCPSDPANPKTEQQGFHGNYLLCNGSQGAGQRRLEPPQRTNGMFASRYSRKIRDLTDGTSNTVMVGEIRLQPDLVGPSGPGNVGCSQTSDWHDMRGRYSNPHPGGVTFTTIRPPNTPVGDSMSWAFGTPNVPLRGCASGSASPEVHARSWHPGGAQFSLADGSVRFISNNIDQNVFQYLGTVAGGEVIGEF